MDMQGKRVLLYIRVSTDEQARHGESILDQAQALHAWAQRQGCIVAGEYHDEGFSARKSYKSRPALSDLLGAVEQGEADAVVFTKLDRWFRNLKDYYKVQEILERQGVFWMAILEDYETRTSAGRFKVNLMLSLAEHEADQTSERIKFTFQQKRARGELVSGHMPRGYILQDGKPVKDPETQDAVSAFWRAILDSGSISKAMDAAKGKGLLIKYYETASGMRKNAASYAGLIQGCRCEPYITEAERDYILSQRRRCYRRSDRVYLFAGIIRCGECGAACSAHADRRRIKNGKPIAYYNCCSHNRSRGVNCQNRATAKEQTIEDYLLASLEGAVQKLRSEAEAREANRQKQQAEISTVRKKIDRLTDAYIDGLIGKDDYRRRKKALEAALEISPQPRGRSVEELKNALHSGWREIYDTLDDSRKQAFWRRNVQEIQVFSDGKITFNLLP